MSIKPVDLRILKAKANNLYEAVIVSAKEARRINEENKTEFTNLISTFAPATDDDFDERDNQEQEKISLEFEKRNKPHVVAVNKMVDDKIDYRFKNKEE
ncbi:MAG: DNA-directed RNA polymerase subunit omega [Ignavibacteriae bacterium]|nr:DNA-directed RNA polymerase subunit omega [Ignavibacteriota bacterium]